MGTDKFLIHKLSNGAVLLGEEVKDVASAAVSILLPFGAATDPAEQLGMSGVLMEMLNKGAGPWDAQALSQQFEDIGAERGTSAGLEASGISAAALGENLPRVLEIISQMLFAPRLPADELDSVKQLALQDLAGLEDNPASKVMVELAKQFYPEPFGRSQIGTVPGVEAITPNSLSAYYKAQLASEPLLIGVAGKFDWQQVIAVVEKEFSKIHKKTARLIPSALRAVPHTHHVHQDTAQLQIALAYPSVSYDDPDYYVAKVIIGLLSGGMAGRLFIEVREKRGLVYRVSASHSAARARAAVFVYAGTTPERGQETLDVILTELNRLKDTVEQDEIARAKADLKARIIMQGESTSSRAGALVHDWWNMDRIRPLEEIKSAIDKVTIADIRNHLDRHRAGPLTVVTLGSKSLELPK